MSSNPAIENMKMYLKIINDKNIEIERLKLIIKELQDEKEK